MKNLSQLLVTLVIALFSIGAVAEPIAFTKQKLVNVLIENPTEKDLKDLPLVLTYPSDFVIEKRDVNGLEMVFIRSPSTDIDCFIKGSPQDCIGGGFFTIALSLNVGYLPAKGKFTGEGEPQDAARLEKAGISNVVSTRRDKNGIPIYEMTAEASTGRHAYLAYAALGNSGSAFRINYYHPKSHSDRDVVIWRAFIDGLGGD